jgi:glycosyltransferase involved in cell wall biosynthesis
MTADTVGGVWTYALELARALGRGGTAVTLATMGAPLSRVQWRETKRIQTLEVRESLFRLEWMQDPWDDVEAAGDWLLALEAELQPDVVHVNGYVHAALPFRPPVVAVAHSCVLSWWRAARGGSAPAEWDRYRREVARGLAAATLVLAPTRAMAADLAREWGATRAQVVWNGRDAQDFRVMEKEPLVLAAGRLWDEAKNVQVLAGLGERIGWPLLVAGDDRNPNGGTASLPGLRALGRLSSTELAAWLARASIFVHPALYEPFGLTPLEAALSGCALVLSDLPSLRELWEGHAEFVNPRDSQAIGATLERLAQDPAETSRLGRAARVRALELSPERMARGYLGAYREAMSVARSREGGRCAS